MTNAIFFIESYHGGGHEKVAEILLNRLNFNKVELFINKRYVSRFLNFEKTRKRFL